MANYADQAGADYHERASDMSLLARERTIAAPTFNRWLVPPAALAIHLSIGMAYGFSVFWLPMSHLLPPGGAACADLGAGGLLSTTCNWSVPSVTHIFEIFIAVLGISAAIWGGWLEHAGPRKAGAIAAVCWGGGLIMLGGAVALHQLWLVYVVAVVCGVGQGLGYITPVSTLIKWFPDHRGMATGFAILGYGGGAMIGAPLAVWLMNYFGREGSVGVAATLAALGLIYLLVMLAGAFAFRVTPSGWRPEGWQPGQSAVRDAMITRAHVHLTQSWRTPQFWLIWGVLCLNVTAGISVISMASPMMQDIFGAKLAGVGSAASLTSGQKATVAAAAAGLVGLVSLFNCLGRIFWASLSDRIGRKRTYYAIFVLGIGLYCLVPTWGHLGMPVFFVLSICIIMTMYGGGFATVPAYLADLFGTQMVGAIHGRLITAWSVAGVVGPALIAGIRQFQIDHGVAPARVYDITLYIMAFLLFCGLVCNFFVKPVDRKHWMSDGQLARERSLQHDDRIAADAQTAARGRFGIGGVLSWVVVGVPFCIGLFIALKKAEALF